MNITQVSTNVCIMRKPLPSDSEPVTLSRNEPITLSGGGALMGMITRLHVEAGLAPGCFGGATAARQGSLAVRE
jgi:hypothetical protein